MSLPTPYYDDGKEAESAMSASTSTRETSEEWTRRVVQALPVKPYYAENGIIIIHSDCRDILPHLPKVDLVLTDPPYGISHPTNYDERGRGKLATCRNYAPVHEDDQPFDPSFILSLNVPTVLFGANYFANQLPHSSGWIVWDKERPHDLDQATCEMAWTNYVKGARVFRFMWNGMIRATHEPLEHPTQKPTELIKWICGLKWTPSGTILDPFMGSGTTLVAAQNLGRKCIGIEISQAYCDIAIRRLQQQSLPLTQPLRGCKVATQEDMYGTPTNRRDEAENISGQYGQEDDAYSTEKTK